MIMVQMIFIDGTELSGKIYCLKYDIERDMRTIKKNTKERKDDYSKTEHEEEMLNQCQVILNNISHYLSAYEIKEIKK